MLWSRELTTPFPKALVGLESYDDESKLASLHGRTDDNLETLGRVSKSQRKYKVRFQSDIRSAKRLRSRHDVEDSASTSSSTLLEGEDRGMEKSSIPSLLLDHQRKGEGTGAHAGNVGVDVNFNDEDPGSTLSAAIMQDASLLYAFSVDNCTQAQTEGLIPTPSPLSGPPSQPSHQAGFEEDRLSTDGHRGHLEPLIQKSTPQTNGLSPQLTFQADILPNIPRQLPFMSTWSEGRCSEKRMYLQYCKAS